MILTKSGGPDPRVDPAPEKLGVNWPLDPVAPRPLGPGAMHPPQDAILLRVLIAFGVSAQFGPLQIYSLDPPVHAIETNVAMRYTFCYQ